MKQVFFTIMLMFATCSMFAQNDVVDNNAVLGLLKEGFKSEEIIGAIENSSTRTITFDINFMRQLKAAGADSNLITYLQKIAKNKDYLKKD